MVRFTIAQLRDVMNNRRNIRNISVIAHVDHGKSTLTDSLIAKAGIIKNDDAGKVRFTDNTEEEKNRGITIKSTGVSLYYNLPKEDLPEEYQENNGFLINLIDSPGHIDFSAEVTAALRVTDGALVVVDCVEGVCVQTETVLRQALAERIKPVVVVNKIDRLLLEVNCDPEEMYRKFQQAIDDVNAIIATLVNEDGPMGDVTVSPALGSVCFGSGLHSFGFTLNKFAKFYSKMFGIDPKKLMPLLWGEHYFDPETKKITSKSTNEKGQQLERTFVRFVLKPIVELCRAITGKDKEKYTSMFKRIGVNLQERELQMEGKELISAVFKRWLPMSEALLEIIVLHLPSPITAQKYRCETLYTGPLDDENAKAIQNCDPNGPLMMYVSKMFPSQEAGKFYAFGRVFSGVVSAGQKVRIMGPNYVPGEKNDLFVGTVQRTVLMMGGKAENINDCPCGNTVSLVGIDNYLVKSGTICSNESAYPIKAMKFSVSPVVRVAVSPKSPADLSKLVDGLNKIAHSDPCLLVTHEATGEHILAGAGELHLEVVLKELENQYAGVPIVCSPPVVTFRETVTDVSSIVCLSKTANKLNRLFCKAEPIGDELLNAIEEGRIKQGMDTKVMPKILQQEFGWEQNDSKRVWSFGPDVDSTNVLVDTTKSAQYLTDIQDSFVSAFQWATKYGVLCEEQLRGVRFNIMDVYLHRDATHRPASQIIPAGRRVLYASEYTAKPKLVEPVYLCEITAPSSVSGGIHTTIAKRRGRAFEQTQREGTPLITIKAYLPVMESFGFDKQLREATSGQAFPQMIFDHWEILDGNPFEPGNQLYDVVKSTRKRKGLSEEVQSIDTYLDKL